MATGKETGTLGGYLTDVEALVFTPDSRYLVAGDSLLIALWNVQTRKLVYTRLSKHPEPLASAVCAHPTLTQPWNV